jgi:hypothetical protein
MGRIHYYPTRTKVSDSEVMRSCAEEDVSLFSRMFAGTFEHRDICHSCFISKFSDSENFVPVPYLIGHLKKVTVCVVFRLQIKFSDQSARLDFSFLNS